MNRETVTEHTETLNSFFREILVYTVYIHTISPRLYNKNSTVSLGYGKQLAKIALTFVKQKTSKNKINTISRHKKRKKLTVEKLYRQVKHSNISISYTIPKLYDYFYEK